MQHIPAFLGVVALISVTPGPDTALVVRNAVSRGRRGGLMTALGSASGLLVWGLAFAVGIGALLAASATAFAVLKLIGAAYLVWLGTRMLLHPGAAAPAGPRASGSAYRQGLLTNLLNPKAAAFFTALVPQFLTDDASPAAPLVLAAIAAAGSLLGLALFATGASAARRRLTRPRVRRALDRVTGTVLVGLGVRLALERRA
jgi:threonine/homoserine/homoserine lactone efflux protein